MSGTLNAIFTGGHNVTLPSISSIFITLAAAFIIGLIITGTYMLTYKKASYDQSFILTLIMIPAIISIIIVLIGDNAARAFGLAGAFSLIRFRSTLGDTKDITYIFFTMACGLACGVGVWEYALLFAVLLCGIMIILYYTKFGTSKVVSRRLRILIPENMNFHGVFEEVFDKYDVNATLAKAKTVDLGSLYELTYDIDINNNLNEKAFIDDLRCRNGNLSIILTVKPKESF